MKNIYPIMLLATFFTSNTFACDEKSWSAEAKKFIEKESPQDSQIAIQKDGTHFNFSVRHKKGTGQYSKNGTLTVTSGEQGSCVVVVNSSQVQTQGDYNLEFTQTASIGSSFSLDKLSGEWSSGCIQMQNGEQQGYVIEQYGFDQSKKITLTRTWFKNPQCKGNAFFTKTENGSFEIGQENTNNGFNPAGTYEAKFSMGNGTELGLLWVNKDFSEMRLSRGFGSFQNTMLALTQYKKSK
jgi:hypothetical protein